MVMRMQERREAGIRGGCVPEPSGGIVVVSSRRRSSLLEAADRQAGAGKRARAHERLTGLARRRVSGCRADGAELRVESG